MRSVTQRLLSFSRDKTVTRGALLHHWTNGLELADDHLIDWSHLRTEMHSATHLITAAPSLPRPPPPLSPANPPSYIGSNQEQECVDRELLWKRAQWVWSQKLL